MADKSPGPRSKVLACLLCLALASPQLALGAVAPLGAPELGSALSLFESSALFDDSRGSPDPLRSYLYDERQGTLTPLGELLYRHLRSRPRPGRSGAGDFMDELAALRGLGEATPERARRIDESLERARADYGGGSLAALDSLVARAGSDRLLDDLLLRAAFDGALSGGPAADVARFEVPGGLVFADAEGVALRLSRRGLVVFDRDLQRRQRRMNEPGVRPPRAPLVPETGRYNVEMLLYGACRLEDQVRALERGLELDRLSRLAELLGEQYHEDQFLDDEAHGFRLRDALLRKARRALDDIPLRRRPVYDEACGGYVTTVLELSDCRLAGRARDLEAARRAVQAYASRVERLRDREALTEADVQGMEGDERLVAKWVALAYLGQQKYYALDRLERLDYEPAGGEVRHIAGEGPEARALRETLSGAPLAVGAREEYRGRARDLALRLQRLLLVLRKLESGLRSADHATGSGRLQGGLAAAQRELGETGLDYALFMSLPALAGAAEAQGRGLAASATGWGARVAGWVGAGRFVQGYRADRAGLAACSTGLAAAAASVAAGDFRGARARLIAAAPEAIRTHHRTELASAGDDASEAQRVQAVLRRIDGSLGRVARTHLLTGTLVHLAAWSLALAAAAPAAGFILSGAAEGCFTGARAALEAAEAAGAAGSARAAVALRAAAVVPRAAGVVFEHAALRLASLDAAPERLGRPTVAARVLEGGLVRAVNASARLGGFSLVMSGGMSGTMAAGAYGIDRLAGDGNSPMPGAWEALAAGYVQGAQWASGAGRQWWSPLLLFAGLPSDVFEGTRGLELAESLAAKGLAGNAWSAARRIRGLGALGSFSLETWARPGGWRAGLSSALAMGDQAAKYFLMGRATGAAAEALARRFGVAEQSHAERGLKRAREEGRRHGELPYWLLLPVYPARQEARALAAQRAREGFRQYEEAGCLDRIANAAVGSARLPFLRSPEEPLAQRLLQLRWRGETTDGGFAVTAEMKYEAIRAELARVSLEPSELYRLGRLAEGEVGRLKLGDEVRDQAQALFEREILLRRGLARAILDAVPGRTVAGFGRVRPDVQQEVARIVAAGGEGLPAAQRLAAERLLEPYRQTERAVDARGKAFVESLQKVEPSPGFQALLEDLLSRSRGLKGGGGGGVSEFVARFRVRASGAGLAPAQARALRAALDYLEAVQARFGRFDRVGAAADRAHGALSALLEEALDGPAPARQAARVLGEMASALERWRASRPDPAAPTGDSYRRLVGDLRRKAAATPGLGGPERELLDRAVRELEDAPYLLKDSKGTGLAGWLPDQFEGLMSFLCSLMAGGRQASETIRSFLLMRTGGGKTVLAFEGLLPIARADARARGKRVIYLTVQPNLESQARIEYRSLRRLGELDMDTWEGFKGRMAQGRLRPGERPEDYWILGDELDGAALQPALSVGEGTAEVPRRSRGGPDPVYEAFRRMRDAMYPAARCGPREHERAAAALGRRLERLTRSTAKELLLALLSGPCLPSAVRWKLGWRLLRSALKPRGSWIESELLGMLRGHLESRGSVRKDNLTGRVTPIHNGQWFESMDTPTRRFWELEYGADLTLPYEHRTTVTMDDLIRGERRPRLVGFSGTAGREFRRYLGWHGVRVIGSGTPEVRAGLAVESSPSSKYARIGRALRELRVRDAGLAAEGRQADGLLIVSVPDTRSLRVARRYLLRGGLAEPGEIAMIFSDSERLRLDRPQAGVVRQMNLEALRLGKAKVLLLDVRVGGRGVDLDFKGARHPGPDDFRGYHRFEMLLLDPQSASEALRVQAQGRIDLGRVPAGSERRFTMILDIPSAQREPVFRRMLDREPLFRRLKALPGLRGPSSESGEAGSAKPGGPDWAAIHRHIEALEARGELAELTAEYRRTLRRYLELQQLEVERREMRSAGIPEMPPTRDTGPEGRSPDKP